MDRSHYPVRKLRLEHQGSDDYTASLTPEERVAMVWTLTLQAWMFKEGVASEPRLRRDIVCTVRSPR